MKMLLLFAVLVIIPWQSGLLATEVLENTLKNREMQAERYLQANPPQDIFQSIAEQNQHMIPTQERQEFVDMLTKHLDMEALNNEMRSSLVKRFTAEEIAVLADFYSMPAAKSAMNKMGLYMSDIMPVVQTEMLKAQRKAMQEQTPD